MSKFAIRILTLAMFVMALAAAPLVTKVHANPDSDAPPPSSTKSNEKLPALRRYRIHCPACRHQR